MIIIYILLFVPTFKKGTTKIIKKQHSIKNIFIRFAIKNSKLKFMPKIYEYFGFIFYFYSNEHEPIHVHVIHGDKESIFDLIIQNGELSKINVRRKKGAEMLSEKDRNIAETFIFRYHKEIIDKWIAFFVLKQNIKCNVITKKI